MNNLENKVAIVTASSRGIGLEITHELVRRGATVYMAVRPSDKNKKLVADLSKENPKYQGVFYNAMDFDSYYPMIDEVIERAGKVDILVNNFGTTNTKEDLTLTTGDSKAFFDIINENIASIYYSCRGVMPHMIKNNGGSIINISSVGGTTPDISRLAYTTSKAAINSLTRNIATQYAHNGVRCNAVLPGFIETDATKDNLTESFKNIFLKNVPLNRTGKPEDIAKAVAFLASVDSSYITGELLPVNGGFGMPTPIYGDMMSMQNNQK